MWQPAVGTGMENDSKVENLEKHLDGKDASEDVVEVGENLIPDWEVFWYLHNGDIQINSHPPKSRNDDLNISKVNMWRFSQSRPTQVY